MIEFSLTYGELIWLAVLYCFGSFIRGFATGLGVHLKKRKTDEKRTVKNLTSNFPHGTLKRPNQKKEDPTVGGV